jgi:hypothetical protein
MLLARELETRIRKEGKRIEQTKTEIVITKGLRLRSKKMMRRLDISSTSTERREIPISPSILLPLPVLPFTAVKFLTQSKWTSGAGDPFLCC